MFQFLETYTGIGSEQHQPGFLVPYFALATFAGIRPNAQGKIVLSFVPTNGMACVNGIEVVEESK